MKEKKGDEDDGDDERPEEKGQQNMFKQFIPFHIQNCVPHQMILSLAYDLPCAYMALKTTNQFDPSSL